MATVRRVLWRKVTDADFLCVERAREHTPTGGGGQTYFSLSFGKHLDRVEFGRFLGLDPPDRIVTERPPVSISAAVLGDAAQREAIEFRPRYQDPDEKRDRYYIARQNRQRDNQARHPAWTSKRGFPVAPDDIANRNDPRMPDLSLLKLIIVQAGDGSYFADYVNADRLPEGASEGLASLFAPNRDVGPDGLIPLERFNLSVEGLAEVVQRARERPYEGRRTSPEIEDAHDATAKLAGAHSRRGQGFRQSAADRAAIDAHAMSVATATLEKAGWTVRDRSVDHPYDLLCRRGRELLHVEVKGTTSDGAAVLLTPNEVAFARGAHPEMALLVVHGIRLSTDEAGESVASDGEVGFLSPWEIDSAGTLRPTGFSYELN